MSAASAQVLPEKYHQALTTSQYIDLVLVNEDKEARGLAASCEEHAQPPRGQSSDALPLFSSVRPILECCNDILEVRFLVLHIHEHVVVSGLPSHLVDDSPKMLSCLRVGLADRILTLVDCPYRYSRERCCI